MLDTLIRLEQPKDAAWPDDYPVVLGEPEANDFASTMALVLIDLGLAAAMIVSIYRAFIIPGGLGFASIFWYEWAIFGTLGVALFATVWPWLKRLDASNDPTDATTFRAWRVNFLVGTIAAGLAILAMGYFVTMYILALFAVGTASTALFGSQLGGAITAFAAGAVLLATWPQLVLMAFSLTVSIWGGFLLYNNKNFWYNYDPDGRRLSVPFNYFGDDVEIEDEEEDINEDEDVGDADFAKDEDFW